MNKVILVAILGLVAVANAVDRIELKPKHYMKLSTPVSLVKNFIHPRLKSDVVWGTCPSAGGFKVDMSKTYNKPQPPQKGDNVELFLAGTFTDDVSLAGLKVYVTWDNNPLYVNDFPRVNDYEEGDPYKDNIEWFIPSFAPSGHYHVELTLHDDSPTPVNFACLTADFDL